MYSAVLRLKMYQLLALMLWGFSVIVHAADSGNTDPAAAPPAVHSVVARPVASAAEVPPAADSPALSASSAGNAEKSQSEIQRAQSSHPIQPKAFKAPGFGFAYYVQLLLGLACVIALIYGCAWLMRRFSHGVVPGAGKMRVISSLTVGAKERIVLVQVGDTQMLLGVAPGRVNTLEVFKEPVIVESEAANPFADKLKLVLSQRGPQ